MTEPPPLGCSGLPLTIRSPPGGTLHRLAVMMYIRYAPSLRQVEDILFERGIDICHGAVRGAAHGSVLVEPVRSAVRRRDQETTP